MRHPSTFVMLFFTICLVQTSLHSQTLITSCNSEFIDSGGQSENYLDNETSDWLICPDTLTEYLELQFTHVDIETAMGQGVDSTGCTDLLSIYDGIDENANLVGSYCGEESGSGQKAFIDGHTLRVGDIFKPTNSTGCFYIKFESNNIERRTGWHAEVNCCVPTLTDGATDGIDLPLAANGGNYFNLDVDNSCTRKGGLEMFTDFEATGSACGTAGLSQPNQSFYTFKSNGIGGFVEFMLEPVDSVGIIEMLVYGPVILNDGKYEGGVINDCVSGEEPWSLFFNAGPEQTYILAMATELAGRTAFTTLSSTLGIGGVLPVDLESYNIEKRGTNAHISWTTAAEINNEGFEVYRSEDAKSFTKIGWIDSKSKHNEGASYEFSDNPSTAGTYYYYIKQVDLNGVSSDFDILKLNFREEVKLSAYPNPSHGIVTLDSDTDMDKSNVIKVFNQLGQLKHQSILNENKNLDLSALESGVYTIQLISDGISSSYQQIISN